MAPKNPYDSLRHVTSDASTGPKLLLWSIGAVFGCVFAGGIVGSSIGAGLGWVAPGYYRSVFPNGESPNFDPVAVGIGQGLTQGAVLGGIIGLVLVAMFYWHQSRKPHRKS